MYRIFLLILLLIPLPLNAEGWFFGSGGGAPVSFSCTDADTICDDYDSDQDCGNDAANAQICRESWTVTEANGALTFAGTASGSIGGQSGTYVAEFNKSGDTSTDGQLAIQVVELTTEYVQFYFNIVSATIDANGRWGTLLYGHNAGYTEAYATIRWEITDRTASPMEYKLVLGHFNQAGAAQTDDSSVTTMQVGTWYGARVYWLKNQESAGVAWWADYNLDGSFTSQTVADGGSTHNDNIVNFGHSSYISATDGNLIKIQYDMLKVDVTEMPAATVP